MPTASTASEKRVLWGCTGALAIAFLICSGLVVVGYAGLRGLMIHKAVYAGGVEFFGDADGWFGTVYDRMYLWDPARPPPSGAPTVELHIDGNVYDARSLSGDILLQLGADESTPGRLFDPRGQVLTVSRRSRNPNISLRTSAPPPANAVAVTAQPIKISIDGGQPFSLPISDDDLKRFAGQPDNTVSWLHN